MSQSGRPHKLPIVDEQAPASSLHDPVCGMTVSAEKHFEPSSTRDGLSVFAASSTCPMHPEVERDGPGACPICGMSLEPKNAALEEANPELADMNRRFWVSPALTIPLMAIAMHGMIPGTA